jgi:hypothetical protein
MFNFPSQTFIMQIANPIYDVVFKYMMEDLRVARIFLGALTELEIIEIQLLPQEFSNNKKSTDSEPFQRLQLSIYRLDFSARVKLEDNKEKIIIIEVQKSNTAEVSMRFRKYLGNQYLNEHHYFDHIDQKARKQKIGLPILSIYFLGEMIENIPDVPVLKMQNSLVDRFDHTLYKNESPFLNSLYHEGIIVNIPSLKEKRRDELEKLLSIFDQANRSSNHHIMNVTELDFPERFRPIIRRLQLAVQKKEVREVMIVEDDFLKEISGYESRLLDALTQKEEERCQKEEERRQKEEERRQKESAIRMMLESGIDAKAISSNLGLPLDYIMGIAHNK